MYVNVSLPILVDMGAASWLDLEVDVVVFADGTKQIVDQAFLDRFARQNDVPQRVMDGPIRTILDTLLEPSLDLRKPNTDKEICTRLSY